MMGTINIKTTTKVIPQCYAYTTPDVPIHDGWTKIGFTERDVETRINEQTHTVGIRHKTWWHMQAVYMTEPFGTFTDKNFHSYLRKLGTKRKKGTEWFFINPNVAKDNFIEFAQNHGNISGDVNEVIPYRLRDEQNDAVERTIVYFQTHENGEFLWNAKPRFGKTLAAYDLCKRIQAKNILIVTNRPAIANSWYDDYETFLGVQSGYVFVSNIDGLKDKKYVKNREQYLKQLNDDVKGCIEFVSLQDLKGSIYFGGQYDKLSELSSEKGLKWDILIIDEAHEGVDTYKTDTAFNHISRKWTLHLSGTPFKALANDKFPEEAIYNWTYEDEQRRKHEWNNTDELENPYSKLPQLTLYTYKMSDIVRDKVKKGIELADENVIEYAFDLNEFFATKDNGEFIYDQDVDRFLDALTRQDKFPFSTPKLRNELKHTFWILNRVASAKALVKKLRIHPIFKDYQIVLAAGDGRINKDDDNEKAFKRVTNAIKKYDKTITLSVGQLTTGVTIPEWTAVLMLSNMSSPALYMQAAFRVQTPYLFYYGKNESYRKKNAYIFDFDPARTLDIFEKFANDLSPDILNEKDSYDQRKNNVRELLNFFPIYGEDDQGSMIELDAEKVLTIPRHIHAREVVERGFMSNFLFSNISGIFSAPNEVIDIINNMHPIEEPKGYTSVKIDRETANELNLNENGEVEIPSERIIGDANRIFGKKVYSDVRKKLTKIVDDIKCKNNNSQKLEKNKLDELQKKFSEPVAEIFVDTSIQKYGNDLKKVTQKQLVQKIQSLTNDVVKKEYGNYTINSNKLDNQHKEELSNAQDSGLSIQEINDIEKKYQIEHRKNYEEMVGNINDKLQDDEVIIKVAEAVTKIVETENLNRKKESIEEGIRNHLRGFSRTIPAFLMAYGDENTTLANFDKLVPEDVFWEVTSNPQTGKGITIKDFCFLRDGGVYKDKDTGEEVHFKGHLFDEVVFDDAVQEFIKKRSDMANYFDEDNKGDIFDYIPPQRTNQIFTPRAVVKKMVHFLEKENPDCFDNPDSTFADLYMKSGMYITEIVTRLYQSKVMQSIFPDKTQRLNHIFAKQVYGCAPTEIIYRICLQYILGFSDKIHIDKHNIKLCNTLEYAKKGTVREKMKELFNL